MVNVAISALPISASGLFHCKFSCLARPEAFTGPVLAFGAMFLLRVRAWRRHRALPTSGAGIGGAVQLSDHDFAQRNSCSDPNPATVGTVSDEGTGAIFASLASCLRQGRLPGCAPGGAVTFSCVACMDRRHTKQVYRDIVNTSSSV